MCGLADAAGVDCAAHAAVASRLQRHRSFHAPTGRACEVPARTLDECVRTWRVDRIDLMKIDVEGAEPLVLAGGADALTRGIVRHAMIEVNGPRLTEAGSGPGELARDARPTWLYAGVAGTGARVTAGRGARSTSTRRTRPIVSSSTGTLLA